MSLMCRIFKNDTNKLIYKTEIDSQKYKKNLWVTEVGGDKLGV